MVLSEPGASQSRVRSRVIRLLPEGPASADRGRAIKDRLNSAARARPDTRLSVDSGGISQKALVKSQPKAKVGESVL
jgi:hypothetical protein